MVVRRSFIPPKCKCSGEHYGIGALARDCGVTKKLIRQLARSDPDSVTYRDELYLHPEGANRIREFLSQPNVRQQNPRDILAQYQRKVATVATAREAEPRSPALRNGCNGRGMVFADQTLLEHLVLHPEALYELDPRRFEEVIAELWRRRGYTVRLTPQTRDGGKDVYAALTTTYGDELYVIECKRYAPDRPVSVEIVRALYGVVEEERTTMGLVVTTSSFTKAAHDFQRKVANRITLAAHNELKQWLNEATRGSIAPAARPRGTVIH